MPAKITSSKEIESLPLAEKPYIKTFADGFGIRVRPEGGKAFVYLYRHPIVGKKLLTLGAYAGPPSLDAAIRAHRAARAELAAGGDPAATKATAKAAAKTAKALDALRAIAEPPSPPVDERPALRTVAAQWIAADLKLHVTPDGQRLGRKDSGEAVRKQFVKWVYPKLGDKVAAEVTKGDVMVVIGKAKEAGRRRTAQSIFANLRQMLDYAFNNDIITQHPMIALKKARVAGVSAARKRALAEWEITRFLRCLPTLDMHPVTVLVLRFILCTGQRPGEVAGMAKSELSADGLLWTIPSERYKTGEEQKVPLSKLARSILAEAAKYNTDSEFVFPSPQAVGVVVDHEDDEWEDRAIDRHSMSRAVVRKLGTATPPDVQPLAGTFGLAKFVPHDLRRTCRTHLAALGVSEHVAERVIGHKLQGMMAVYNLHEYLDERRDALECWGAKLVALA